MTDNYFMPVKRDLENERLHAQIRQSLPEGKDVSLDQLRQAASAIDPPLTEEELVKLAQALVPRLKEIERFHFS